MQKKQNKIIYIIMILVIWLTLGLWTPRLINRVHANYMQQQIDKANEDIEHLAYDRQVLEYEKQDLLERIDEINKEQNEFHKKADEIREWINIQEGLLKSRKAQ